jgi:hypothetical protein
LVKSSAEKVPKTNRQRQINQSQHGRELLAERGQLIAKLEQSAVPLKIFCPRTALIIHWHKREP